MGNRKRQSAEALKEAKKSLAFAKLNNCPTSPRKMRLVADQVPVLADIVCVASTRKSAFVRESRV